MFLFLLCSIHEIILLSRSSDLVVYTIHSINTMEATGDVALQSADNKLTRRNAQLKLKRHLSTEDISDAMNTTDNDGFNFNMRHIKKTKKIGKR